MRHRTETRVSGAQGSGCLQLPRWQAKALGSPVVMAKTGSLTRVLCPRVKEVNAPNPQTLEDTVLNSELCP